VSTPSPRVAAVRLDANRVRLETQSGLDVMLFANARVPVDRASLADVGTLSGIVESVRDLDARGFFGDRGVAAVRRAVLTPDFHRGAGVPVGTVLETAGLVFPRLAGTDIGCGMRLLATDVTREAFEAIGPRLDGMLRHVLFGGGRDIPMDEAGRAAMLREGAAGLRAPPGGGGIWRRLDPARLSAELARHHGGGAWRTRDLWAFGDFVRGSGGVSRDAVVASIGGGNHFLEIQAVEACLDRQACWAWGLSPGTVAIMVHTGSLDLGSAVGGHFADLARRLHPAGLPRPAHGFHPLPLVGPLAEYGRAYLSAMGLAANLAVVNRLMLGELAVQTLAAALGREVGARLVYDAPHNVAWQDGTAVLHRKGACPAELDSDDAVFPLGHPVIVPGSMGDASWVLRGQGLRESLCSAPHGAGRVLARGEGRRADTAELRRLRVVTKVDPLRVRRDVAAEIERGLMEEAPGNYKPVLPAMETCADAGIAVPVAKLEPLLTCKG
jgi:tRNA-splicing ligase RtcB